MDSYGPDMPEFGDLQEYRSAARWFMGGGARPGSIEGLRSDGALIRFDPRSGYLGVRKNGAILTFFRPDGDAFAYYQGELLK
jgi:filamentous hemagglutinin